MDIICYAAGKGEFPENTIEAIKNCQSADLNWWIEIDLQLTKDNKIVLCHDANLKRTTGINKRVDSLSLLEIKLLNAAYNFKVKDKFIYRESKIPIPTLEEVFTLFSSTKFILDIQTKNDLIVYELISLLEKHRKGNSFVIVSKFYSIIKAFKKKKVNYVFGASKLEVKLLILVTLLKLENFFPFSANILMIPIFYNNKLLLKPRILEFVKSKNLKLWVWLTEGSKVETINSKILVNKLKQKGVDGIFTSCPQKIKLELQTK